MGKKKEKTNIIFGHCALTRGENFQSTFDFHPSTPFSNTSRLSLSQERERIQLLPQDSPQNQCVSGTTLEAGSFGAVSKLSRNRSKSGDGRKRRDDSPLLTFQIDSPRKRPLSRNGRLGGKRTKGMHNVTWDEIRGGMCVNVKRHVDIGNVSLCGFTAPSWALAAAISLFLALSPSCPSRFKDERRMQYETKRERAVKVIN